MWPPDSPCRWCSDVSPGHIDLPLAQSKEVEPYWISCYQDVLSSLCLPGSQSCSLRNTSSVLCTVPVGKTYILELEGQWVVRCQSFHSTPGFNESHLHRQFGYNFEVWHRARDLQKGSEAHSSLCYSLKPDNDSFEGCDFFQAHYWRISLNTVNAVRQNVLNSGELKQKHYY